MSTIKRMIEYKRRHNLSTICPYLSYTMSTNKTTRPKVNISTSFDKSTLQYQLGNPSIRSTSMRNHDKFKGGDTSTLSKSRLKKSLFLPFLDGKKDPTVAKVEWNIKKMAVSKKIKKPLQDNVVVKRIATFEERYRRVKMPSKTPQGKYMSLNYSHRNYSQAKSVADSYSSSPQTKKNLSKAYFSICKKYSGVVSKLKPRLY